ncbi:F-box protein [Melia azedarach]|uniref:F-box protein n=1 Tax=Melia azedarach TaxID=155640 RepID=A0ACC1Z1S8_MELAZ|nr:F-box protein [Melia azedarach]
MHTHTNIISYFEAEKMREMQSNDRGSHCFQLQPKMQLSISGMVLKIDDIRNYTKTSRKKKTTNNCKNWRPWPDLPVELLDIISSHLRIADYLKLGRVCWKWRYFFLSSRQKFMASQPPLVLFVSSRAKRTCCFYDIFDFIKYEAKLPYFCCKSFIGLSCGYTIMEDILSNIWLTNPITGHQHVFASMPLFDDCMHICEHTILACTRPYPDFLVVVLSKLHCIVRFRRYRETYWSVYHFAGKPWKIMDMVVFNARIFVITSDLQIGVLSLGSPPDVLLLSFKCTPQVSCCPRFVASNDRLVLVDFIPSVALAVYTIDFMRREWVKVDNLGDQSLFLGDLVTPSLCSTTKWGGRSNCVYYLPFKSTRCFVYSLNGELLSSIIVSEADPIVSPRMNSWYFPHQSYGIDVVRDDKYVGM